MWNGMARKGLTEKTTFADDQALTHGDVDKEDSGQTEALVQRPRGGSTEISEQDGAAAAQKAEASGRTTMC